MTHHNIAQLLKTQTHIPYGNITNAETNFISLKDFCQISTQVEVTKVADVKDFLYKISSVQSSREKKGEREYLAVLWRRLEGRSEVESQENDDQADTYERRQQDSPQRHHRFGSDLRFVCEKSPKPPTHRRCEALIGCEGLKSRTKS